MAKKNSSSLEQRIARALDDNDIQAVKDILCAQREETLAALRKPIDGEWPLCTLAAMDVRRSEPEGRVALVEVLAELIDAGLKVNPQRKRTGPPLNAIIRNRSFDPASRRMLVDELLERGADPDALDEWGCDALGGAIAVPDADMVELFLAPDLSPERLRDALATAIRHSTYYVAEARPEMTYPVLERVLSRVDDMSVPAGKPALPPVFHALRTGDDHVLATVLDRSEVDLALPHEVVFCPVGMAPPGGGIVPKLIWKAGTTPLQATEQLYAVLSERHQNRRQGREQDGRFEIEERAERLAGLWRARELFLARGAKPTGADLQAPEPEVADGVSLAGLKLVLTGTLDTYNREHAKELLEGLGAKVTGSISGTTHFLIAGSNTGEKKLSQARELGVTVLSEDDLRAVLTGAVKLAPPAESTKKTRAKKASKGGKAERPSEVPVFRVVEGCAHTGARAVLHSHFSKELRCGWCGAEVTQVELVRHEPARLAALTTWVSWTRMDPVSPGEFEKDVRAHQRLAVSTSALKAGDRALVKSLWSKRGPRPADSEPTTVRGPAAREAALFDEMLQEADALAFLIPILSSEDEARARAALSLLARGGTEMAVPARYTVDPRVTPDVALADALGRGEETWLLDVEREKQVKRAFVAATHDGRRVVAEHALAHLGACRFPGDALVWTWLDESERQDVRGAAFRALERAVEEGEAGTSWDQDGVVYGPYQRPFLWSITPLFEHLRCIEPGLALALLDRMEVLENSDAPGFHQRSYALRTAMLRGAPGAAAVPALIRMVEKEKYEHERAIYLNMLAHTHDPDALRWLVAQLDSPIGEEMIPALGEIRLSDNDGWIENDYWEHVREEKLERAGEPLDAPEDTDAWQERVGEEGAQNLPLDQLWATMRSADFDPLRIALERENGPNSPLIEYAWLLWARTGELIPCGRPGTDAQVLADLRAAVAKTNPTPSTVRVDITQPYSTADVATEDEDVDEDEAAFTLRDQPHVGFNDSTYALLVAGRVSRGTVTYAKALRLAAWAEEHDLVCVPSGDLSSTGAVNGNDARIYMSLVLGDPVVRADADDGGPAGGKTLDELRDDLAASRGKLKAVAGQLAELGVTFDTQHRLHLVSCGPLCAGILAIGEVSDDEDAELIRGTDSEQLPHYEGVLGSEIGWVSYSGDSTLAVDLSPAAHERRVKDARDAGADEKLYHLMAAFDVS